MEPERNELIINADDFGLDHQTNLAVVRTFDLGLCSSCTIMANMPGFEEACELVREHGLTANAGLHLTLTEAAPVTERIRMCPRFCNSAGEFRLSRREHVLVLRTHERQALAEEISGQIGRCRRRGVPLTHVDAHGHVHEEWAILSVLMNVVREAGIRHIRVCKTFGFGVSHAKRFYRRIVNARLHRAGLARTHHFGAPDDYRLFCQMFQAAETPAGSWEVMIHPALDADGGLIDSWLKRPIVPMVRAIPGYEQARSYTGHHFCRSTGDAQHAIA